MDPLSVGDTDLVLTRALDFLSIGDQGTLEQASTAWRRVVHEYHRDGILYRRAKDAQQRNLLVKRIVNDLARLLRHDDSNAMLGASSLLSIGPREEWIAGAAELPQQSIVLARLINLCTAAASFWEASASSTVDGLERGFVSLSALACPEGHVDGPVYTELDRLAVNVRRHIKSAVGNDSGPVPTSQQVLQWALTGTVSMKDCLRALVTVLFTTDGPDCAGLAGDDENYDDMRNRSLRHCLLVSKVGLPITLSAVLVCVAHRAGVPGVRGVGTPRHFVCKYDPQAADAEVQQITDGASISVAAEGNGDEIFVDPFNGGAMYSGRLAFLDAFPHLGLHPASPMLDPTDNAAFLQRAFANVSHSPGFVDALRGQAESMPPEIALTLVFVIQATLGVGNVRVDSLVDYRSPAWHNAAGFGTSLGIPKAARRPIPRFAARHILHKWGELSALGSARAAGASSSPGGGSATGASAASSDGQDNDQGMRTVAAMLLLARQDPSASSDLPGFPVGYTAPRLDGDEHHAAPNGIWRRVAAVVLGRQDDLAREMCQSARAQLQRELQRAAGVSA